MQTDGRMQLESSVWALDHGIGHLYNTATIKKLFEGSLEVKLPTIWTDESSDGTSQRREDKRREEDRRSEKRKSQRKEKVAKSRNTLFFQWFVAPESQKVGLLKLFGAIWPDERRKVARHCGGKHVSESKCVKHTTFRAILDVEMLKMCTPLWCKAFFGVKMCKAHHVQSDIGS